MVVQLAEDLEHIEAGIEADRGCKAYMYIQEEGQARRLPNFGEDLATWVRYPILNSRVLKGDDVCDVSFLSLSDCRFEIEELCQELCENVCQQVCQLLRWRVL